MHHSWTHALILGAALGSGAVALTAQTFGTPASLPLKELASGVEVGDLDRDGHLDLISANPVESTVSVFLGDGSGGFGSEAEYAVAGSPQSVTLGDLNDDGILDLVVTDFGGGLLSVLKGDGSGGFHDRVGYPVVGYPGVRVFGVEIADLTADGIPDVVVTKGELSLFEGDGAGGLGPRRDYGVSAEAGAVADLNADGALDVVVADGTDHVRVLLGDGLGGLGPAISSFALVSPVSIAVGDVNQDGKLDVAVLNPWYWSQPAKVGVLFGDGQGGFTHYLFFDVGRFPLDVQIGDVSGDGLADLVTTSGLGTVTVLLGGGGSGAFQSRADLGAGPAPWGVRLCDLDSDGACDILVFNRGSLQASVTLLLNQDLPPVGVVAFGTGTPGCAGTIGMSATSVPRNQAWTFGLRCTNAPPNSLNVILLSASPDVPGSMVDPLGVLSHLAMPSVHVGSFTVDASGCGYMHLPIWGVQTGQQVHCQGYFLASRRDGRACSGSQFGRGIGLAVESSRGLTLTFQ